MILFPNAKINLGLHVLAKRADNFHELETFMYPVGLSDILEFIPSREAKTTFRSTGILLDEDYTKNLVYKAYLILKEKYGLPELKIHLHKIIPTGAGLGGGSSDAAFMLKGLNEFFKLEINNTDLERYASELGSDCSFFISNKPAIARGKGEILSPAGNYLSNFKILLLYPGFHVSTAEAYKGITPDSKRESLIPILESGVSVWRTALVNDFEKTILKTYPVLDEIKQRLYKSGAVYASMSGSGSAMYGVFEKIALLPNDFNDFQGMKVFLPEFLPVHP